MSLAISTEFGYCVIVAVAMAIQCKARVMDVEAFRERYNMPHPESDGGQLEGQLSDEDRAKFNRIKHLRDSCYGHLITALPLFLLAALFYPRLTINQGVMYMLAHAAYNWFYTRGKLEACKYCMLFIKVKTLMWAVLAMHGAAMVTIFA
ncbi:hypothetical protein IWQ57_002786 [Coemansia nantahalensis]|uniref:Uncharacterized protein n=1 Tax=Coemansia nantahalensis TaxID=2789366 RepID=A0ACC1JZ56_9FUNG|nr:hypothetical protein IWQ57_002786 [Coemansia nantahalensis]